MDGRINNGSKKGENRNAGRKPKATEIELIERLTPLEEIAFKAMRKGLENGDFAFVKLFLEFRFGRPKQQIQVEPPKELIVCKMKLPDGQIIEI
jgi:hypothetical protein